MSDNQYIAPMQRALHQQGLKTLLLVQFATIIPFLSYLPLWLLAVFALVVYWRRQVFRGRMEKPPKWLVLGALASGIGAMLVTGLNRYTLDSAVAFCILGYLLKSLEVLRRRDGVFQVYLGFFLTGVYLLYRFDLVGGLLMVLLLFLNVIALQAVTSEGYFKWSYAIRQSSLLILGAIPVMLAGYLFFPRIPPLWQIPNEQRGAQTGMTDEINPGEIAELAQSREPVFRVNFSSVIPPREQWYWRGNTMSVFTGRSWKALYSETSGSSFRSSSVLPKAEQLQFDYNVVMERSGRRWMYFLDWPTEISNSNVWVLPDGRGMSKRPINNIIQYRAKSSSQVSWQNQSGLLNSNTQLPSTGNEDLREWAENARSAADSDRQFINNILDHIRTQQFYYTLKPPIYGGPDSLSEFWLNGRRGFCSHYASALGFILRSAGIPSRLVGGYLGGQFNSSRNYIQVRQMEAHVWVEAWIDGTWLRIDPTAAVAPSRIQMNLDALFSQTQPTELTLLSRLNQLSAINKFSMYWDSIQYQWQILVLNYENDIAIGWFESAFGRFTALKAAIAVLTLLGSVALVVAVLTGLIRFPKYLPEPLRTLRRIERKFGPRHRGETVQQYFNRLDRSKSDYSDWRQIGQLINSGLYKSFDEPARSKLKRYSQDLRLQKWYLFGK